MIIPDIPSYLCLDSVYLPTIFRAIPPSGVASWEILVMVILDCVLPLVVLVGVMKYLPTMKLRTSLCVPRMRVSLASLICSTYFEI